MTSMWNAVSDLDYYDQFSRREDIDPDEGRDDVTASAAVNECENCGRACDNLIDLPTWNFKACETCAEEAEREDRRTR